jgi:ABC-type bacteriocin/lantibiotic exporter with double-glycine peptidase domain
MRALLILVALAACSTYRGTARDVSPAKLAAEPGWVLIREVPYHAQKGETDCGAAAIGMVVAYWTGQQPSAVASLLRPVGERGLKASRLRDFTREHGLAAYVIEGKVADIARELAAGRPVLVGLSKPQRKDRVLDHYEVVVGLHEERGLIVTLDPSEGWRQNTIDGFVREWKIAGFVTLVVSSKS